jgi:hypothetical protein
VNYPYWTGADLSRSFFAVAGSTPSAIVGYEIDAYGGIHPFAGAGTQLPPNLFPFAYWNGQDLGRVIFGG